MSVVTHIHFEAHTNGPDDPCFAHKQSGHDPFTALCGKRLVGINAGTNPSRKCPDCLRVMREWEDALR